MSHDIRMKCIDIDIVQPRHKAVQNGVLDKTKEPFSVRSKQFFPVEKAEWVCFQQLRSFIEYMSKVKTLTYPFALLCSCKLKSHFIVENGLISLLT